MTSRLKRCWARRLASARAVITLAIVPGLTAFRRSCNWRLSPGFRSPIAYSRSPPPGCFNPAGMCSASTTPGGHAAAGIRDGEREHGLVAHEHAVAAVGLDDQPRPRDDRAGRGFGLEADGGHAADFAFFGGHDLHFDRRFAARLERAQRPDEFSPRALRGLRCGAQQTRAAGNLVVDLDLAGSRRAGVPHDDSQHGRPPDLDFRRGDLLDHDLRALRTFKLLVARLAGAAGG